MEEELVGLRNAMTETQRSRENDSNENTALRKIVEELKAEIEQLNGNFRWDCFNGVENGSVGFVFVC